MKYIKVRVQFSERNYAALESLVPEPVGENRHMPCLRHSTLGVPLLNPDTQQDVSNGIRCRG